VDAADDRVRPDGAEEAMSAEATITDALRRSAVCRMLATAFAYPTPERLQWLAGVAGEGSGGAPPGLQDPLRRLASAAREADASRVAADHVSLFQRQVRCPPYEGAYGPPQMAGKAALLADIAGFYRAFGLEPSEGQPEVEDHVAAELEFLSLLALKEAWALAEDHEEGLEITRTAQRAFLADHLARWGTVFARRVAAEAQAGFYPVAAALLEAWLAAECARLQVVAAHLEGVTAAEDAPFACPMAPAQEERP
jgi:DMSO reductase family type II enzyme chaperone